MLTGCCGNCENDSEVCMEMQLAKKSQDRLKTQVTEGHFICNKDDTVKQLEMGDLSNKL